MLTLPFHLIKVPAEIKCIFQRQLIIMIRQIFIGIVIERTHPRGIE